MAKGVQYRGVASVIRAFENLGLAKWAIIYDNNVFHKYQDDNKAESDALFKQVIKALEAESSTAIYTLRFYEGLPKASKIKFSTEADYAFNFTLYDDLTPSPYYQHRNSQFQLLEEKLTKIEAKLNAYDQDDDPNEKEGGIGGFLNGLVEDQDVKTWIKEKMMGLADKIISPSGTLNLQTQPATMGNITQDSEVLIDEEQHNKLQSAVDILIRIDPKLGDNLLDIAQAAQKNPTKYLKGVPLIKTFFL